MHTPGPWRAMHVESGEYYTHQIESAQGHIASIVGWTDFGTVCPTTDANARLIAHAPDMAAVLRALLHWSATMGKWDAPCWEAARNVLADALGCDTGQSPATRRSP